MQTQMAAGVAACTIGIVLCLAVLVEMLVFKQLRFRTKRVICGLMVSDVVFLFFHIAALVLVDRNETSSLYCGVLAVHYFLLALSVGFAIAMPVCGLAEVRVSQVWLPDHRVRRTLTGLQPRRVKQAMAAAAAAAAAAASSVANADASDVAAGAANPDTANDNDDLSSSSDDNATNSELGSARPLSLIMIGRAGAGGEGEGGEANHDVADVSSFSSPSSSSLSSTTPSSSTLQSASRMPQQAMAARPARIVLLIAVLASVALAIAFGAECSGKSSGKRHWACSCHVPIDIVVCAALVLGVLLWLTLAYHYQALMLRLLVPLDSSNYSKIENTNRRRLQVEQRMALWRSIRLMLPFACACVCALAVMLFLTIARAEGADFKDSTASGDESGNGNESGSGSGSGSGSSSPVVTDGGIVSGSSSYRLAANALILLVLKPMAEALAYLLNRNHLAHFSPQRMARRLKGRSRRPTPVAFSENVDVRSFEVVEEEEVEDTGNHQNVNDGGDDDDDDDDDNDNDEMKNDSDNNNNNDITEKRRRDFPEVDVDDYDNDKHPILGYAASNPFASSSTTTTTVAATDNVISNSNTPAQLSLQLDFEEPDHVSDV